MKKNPLLYTFFILIIIITLIDIIEPKKKFSELENRNLKTSADFTAKRYLDGNFSKEYEKCINDQFISRDRWINFKAINESFLGKEENNNILYGKENYLFDKFTSLNNSRIESNIKAINAFCKNVNGDVSVIIAPNSYQIYNEYLPKNIQLVNQEEELEKIYNKLDVSKNINLVPIMKQNKEQYIYYRTDHHWTTKGAYLAYKEYMKNLGEEAIELDDYEETNVSNFYGTYYSKAKPINKNYDILTYYAFSEIKTYINNEVYDGLYDYSKLNIRDKYSFFIYGNNPLTIIKNDNLKNNKKLLLVKDSYANSMIPFLTQHFEEIHIIDLRSFQDDIYRYIEKYNFKDILIIYNFINFSKDANLTKIIK